MATHKPTSEDLARVEELAGGANGSSRSSGAETVRAWT
jgi:hypothetical protein